MKVILFGKNSESVKFMVEKFGFKIVNKKPDFSTIDFNADSIVLIKKSDKFFNLASPI